ncbi:DUF397 domain-containing protein [Nocardiopsis exhalans]|uniref:DUF397 domain-containing protein n=1 Tax=Nocardiopsis exhalans TaxID=163604 RepID=A0ABY5DC31_9ACTN|nr:DUF397 domain-containing protein [Nocardiopsis exhalans]USY20593.1 DUF397 domain-containing protein [Nocardiopsis exhalans]
MKGLGTDLGRWRKSSYSADQGNCVETALRDSGEVRLRDSSRPNDTTLGFGPCEWTALLQHVMGG